MQRLTEAILPGQRLFSSVSGLDVYHFVYQVHSDVHLLHFEQLFRPPTLKWRGHFRGRQVRRADFGYTPRDSAWKNPGSAEFRAVQDQEIRGSGLFSPV